VRTLAARRAQLEAFERDVMQHLVDLRRMAEDAYRGGQGGILELLDAEGAITDAELRHVDLLAQVVAAEVDVQAAAGLVDVDYRP
jgi:cobalt-zinc-cadmium efflux system outer membrane protein